MSAVISGTGTLTKNGSGTLTLTAANTYSGVSALGGGIVNLGHSETAGYQRAVLGTIGMRCQCWFHCFLGGGTLQYSSANKNDYSGRFSTGASQQYKVDLNGQAVTWATALTSSGGSMSVGDSAGSGVLDPFRQ